MMRPWRNWTFVLPVSAQNSAVPIVLATESPMTNPSNPPSRLVTAVPRSRVSAATITSATASPSIALRAGCPSIGRITVAE